MYYDNNELESKIKSILRKYKLRCRYVSINSDIVILGVEASKSDSNEAVRKLSRLGLRKVNLVYGRWVFKR